MNKILKLNPFHSSKIWGYEEWNLSTHKNGLCTVVDSEVTLLDSIGRNLPILIKVIQANDTLSVQVHPDDNYSRIHENDNGKTDWAFEGEEITDKSITDLYLNKKLPERKKVSQNPIRYSWNIK